MSMTKFALSALLAAAVGLVWATAGLAEAPPTQKRAEEPTWDMGGPPSRTVAMDDRDQPPGPPPDAADRPPPPNRRGDAEGDRRGPPDRRGDAEEDRRGPPPDRRGGPEGDRRGPPDGRRGDGPSLPPPPVRWPRNGAEMRETDPDMFNLVKEEEELERQSRDLAQQFRKASGDERAKIKDLVEKTVNRHFDVRQQRRALELKRLEEELKRLHDSLDRREKARKDLVEKRVSDLLGQEDDSRF